MTDILAIFFILFHPLYIFNKIFLCESLYTFSFFLNINSIKYNPEETTTTIKIYTDSKNIIIDVIDDGVGIKKEDLTKIFDRFYQVDGSSTRSGSGTGIGLSIVKELVELHGGDITVESEVGAGSTFRVSLPMDWGIERGNKSGTSNGSGR
ncbi:MAG: sensory histidine kinase AtoS [Candidatus Syntrophoarchaeum sp. GoM_oil]|nr:MAG: sensory histidine kinase AtoS [Candidatus Syntrophoarchaeum sp. GoM_oil]